MNITLFDFIYLFYIAITESLFVQISTIVIFYVVSFYIRHPQHDRYYHYKTHSGEIMPRYDLNHQDVQTIVSGLSSASQQASSSQEFNRINNLKNRLLSKLEVSNDDIDVWAAFQGDR